MTRKRNARRSNFPVFCPSARSVQRDRGSILDPGIKVLRSAAPPAEFSHRIYKSVTQVLSRTVIHDPCVARMAAARWCARPSSPSGAKTLAWSAETQYVQGPLRGGPCQMIRAVTVRSHSGNLTRILHLPSMAPSALQVMSESASSAFPNLGRPIPCCPCTAASTSRRYAICAVSSTISARYWALMSDGPTPIVP